MNCKLVCAFADFVLKVDWSMRSVIVHTLKLLHAIPVPKLTLKLVYIALHFPSCAWDESNMMVRFPFLSYLAMATESGQIDLKRQTKL